MTRRHDMLAKLLAATLSIAMALSGIPTQALAEAANQLATAAADQTAADQTAADQTDLVAGGTADAPSDGASQVSGEDGTNKTIQPVTSAADGAKADSTSTTDASLQDSGASASAALPQDVATDSSEAPVPQVSASVSVVGVDAFGSAQTWATGTYTVDEGTSATVASKQLFSASGLTVNGYDTDYGYYLDSIVSPATGETLGWDSSTGRYWQLFVNGQVASTGADGVLLKDGDSVVWCYSAWGEALPTTDQRTVTARIRVVGPDAANKDSNWLALTELSVPEGTTAADLTEQVLSAAGLAHESSNTAYGYYLSTITSPVTGAALGWDEATGRYWQLFVNGQSSDVGASSVVLKAGDVISWQYSPYGASVSTPTDVATNPDAPRPSYDAAWPSYRGPDDGTTTAATPTKGAEATWTQSMNPASSGMDWANCSDPIVVNGNVYLAVNDQLQIRDGATGEVKATAQLAGSIGYFSRIAYAGGLVLVPLEDGRLQAITATTDKPETVWVTGSLTADAENPQHSFSTILVRNNHAYLGTTTSAPGEGGWLLSVDLADGASARVASGSGYYWAGLASVGTNVVVAEESGRVTVRSAATLAELGHLDLGAEVRSGVAAGGDGATAYVVTLDGTLHKLAVGADGSLSELGSVRFANYSTSTPTVADGKVYVGGGSKSFAGEGGIYVIDAQTMTVTSSATKLASGESLPGDVKSAPLVATGEGGVRVYFTSNGKPGGVYAWKPGDATVTLMYLPEAAAQNYSTSSVAADADGSLYYTNDSGTLFKLAAKDKTPPQELPKDGGDDTPDNPDTPDGPDTPIDPSNGNGGATNDGNGATPRRDLPSWAKAGTSTPSQVTTATPAGNGSDAGAGDAGSGDATTPVATTTTTTPEATTTTTTTTTSNGGGTTTTEATTTGADVATAEDGGLPVWPIVGMVLAAALILFLILAKRRRNKDEEA